MVYYVDYFYGCIIVMGEVYWCEEYMVVYKIYFKGILLKVICLDNGLFIVVWVNDCGLFVEGFMIDIFKVVVMDIGLFRDGKV